MEDDTDDEEMEVGGIQHEQPLEYLLNQVCITYLLFQ